VKPFLVLADKLVLPYPQDPPPLRPQRTVDQPVAQSIGFELLLPKIVVTRRQLEVFRAPMPETSIHKNREAQPWKHEIRPAKYRLNSNS
jgi:hypothetical protein